MESRANYALVGLFTLAVLAAAFGFVYWFSSGGTGRKQDVRVIFSGTVTGLGRGSSVLFNGLRVGEVTSIYLQPDDPRRIYGIISIENTTPLRVDTRARIEAQGLAGVVAVQLLGGDPNSPVLQPQPGQNLPTIVAEQSEFQDILETVRTIAKRADEVLGSVESVVKANAEPINATVRNVERFSAALGDNADGVAKLMQSFGQIGETIAPLADKLGTLSEEMTAVVKTIDRNRIASMIDNIDRFTAALGNQNENIAKVAREAASITEKLDTAINPDAIAGIIKNAESFMSTLGGVTPDVTRTLQGASELVDRLSKSVNQEQIARTLANVDKFAAALGDSSQDAGRAVRDVASIAEKLDRAADQIEGVLKGAQNFLNSAAGEEGKSTFAEIAEAARSIRVLADNLDKRTAEITAGIAGFTGPGLRQIEALTSEGRRTITDLNRTIRSLERNPQQFIFGGKPPLPQYNGSR